MIRRLPAEMVASLLAATTVVISLPPFNLPPWAVFVSWAGTFAAGGPKLDVLRRIWLAMPVGSTYAMIIAWRLSALRTLTAAPRLSSRR